MAYVEFEFVELYEGVTLGLDCLLDMGLVYDVGLKVGELVCKVMVGPDFDERSVRVDKSKVNGEMAILIWVAVDGSVLLIIMVK